jgi:hypothetical protein
MRRTFRSNLTVWASSSSERERTIGAATTLLIALTVALLLTLLARLFVVLVVMLPVARLMGVFVRSLITPLVILLVPLLVTRLSTPMSRSALPARTSQDDNRPEKYCIPNAPLCREIISRKEECIITRALSV